MNNSIGYADRGAKICTYDDGPLAAGKPRGTISTELVLITVALDNLGNVLDQARSYMRDLETMIDPLDGGRFPSAGKVADANDPDSPVAGEPRPDGVAGEIFDKRMGIHTMSGAVFNLIDQMKVCRSRLETLI